MLNYHYFTRYPPFYGKTDKGIMKKVLKGKYQFEG